jgi:hypothetical protein
MWRRIDLVRADISEERIASIFRVEQSASEEPAWAGGCRQSVHTRSTRRHIPEDGILHSHRRKNLKSYKALKQFRNQQYNRIQYQTS